ncbi:MAG: phospholipase D-like domain-containing protein [Bacillota bacterium]|nr:phospholipase D-like domain-containing protein [Bacillota bacterium]
MKAKRKTLGILIVALLIPLVICGCNVFKQSAVNTNVSMNDNTLSYYFPRDGQDAEGKLIDVINSAKSKLDIAAYSFTDTKIGDAVTAAKNRGVAVRVITDEQCSTNLYQKKLLNSLKDDNIPIKDNSHSGLMHLKVTIVDDSICTTGSFNYTISAQKTNDEVLVVIKNSETAKDFEKQFERMWNDKEDFTDY